MLAFNKVAALCSDGVGSEPNNYLVSIKVRSDSPASLPEFQITATALGGASTTPYELAIPMMHVQYSGVRVDPADAATWDPIAARLAVVLVGDKRQLAFCANVDVPGIKKSADESDSDDDIKQSQQRRLEPPPSSMSSDASSNQKAAASPSFSSPSSLSTTQQADINSVPDPDPVFVSAPTSSSSSPQILLQENDALKTKVFELQQLLIQRVPKPAQQQQQQHMEARQIDYVMGELKQLQTDTQTKISALEEELGAKNKLLEQQRQVLSEQLDQALADVPAPTALTEGVSDEFKMLSRSTISELAQITIDERGVKALPGVKARLMDQVDAAVVACAARTLHAANALDQERSKNAELVAANEALSGQVYELKTRVGDRVTELTGSIEGLVQQKDEADARVAELEEQNKALQGMVNDSRASTLSLDKEKEHLEAQLAAVVAAVSKHVIFEDEQDGSESPKQTIGVVLDRKELNVMSEVSDKVDLALGKACSQSVLVARVRQAAMDSLALKLQHAAEETGDLQKQLVDGRELKMQLESQTKAARGGLDELYQLVVGHIMAIRQHDDKNALSAWLQDPDRSVERVRRELGGVSGQYDALLKRASDAESTLERLRQQFSAEMEELRMRHDSNSAKLVSRESVFDSEKHLLEKSNADLHEILTATKKKLVAAESRAKKFASTEHELQQAIARNDTIEHELREYKTVSDKLRQRHQKEILQLQMKLNGSRHSQGALIEGVQKSKAELEKQNNHLRLKVRVLEEKSAPDGWDSEMQSLRGESLTLRRSGAKMRAELAKTTAKNRAHRKTEHELKAKLGVLEKEAGSFRAKYKRLRKVASTTQAHELRDEISEMQANVDCLGEEKIQLEAMIVDLQSDLQEAHTDIQAYKSELDSSETTFREELLKAEAKYHKVIATIEHDHAVALDSARNASEYRRGLVEDSKRELERVLVAEREENASVLKLRSDEMDRLQQQVADLSKAKASRDEKIQELTLQFEFLMRQHSDVVKFSSVAQERVVFLQNEQKTMEEGKMLLEIHSDRRIHEMADMAAEVTGLQKRLDFANGERDRALSQVHDAERKLREWQRGSDQERLSGVQALGLNTGLSGAAARTNPAGTAMERTFREQIEALETQKAKLEEALRVTENQKILAQEELNLHKTNTIKRTLQLEELLEKLAGVESALFKTEHALSEERVTLQEAKQENDMMREITARDANEIKRLGSVQKQKAKKTAAAAKKVGPYNTSHNITTARSRERDATDKLQLKLLENRRLMSRIKSLQASKLALRDMVDNRNKVVESLHEKLSTITLAQAKSGVLDEDNRQTIKDLQVQVRQHQVAVEELRRLNDALCKDVSIKDAKLNDEFKPQDLKLSVDLNRSLANEMEVLQVSKNRVVEELTALREQSAHQQLKLGELTEHNSGLLEQTSMDAKRVKLLTMEKEEAQERTKEMQFVNETRVEKLDTELAAAHKVSAGLREEVADLKQHVFARDTDMHRQQMASQDAIDVVKQQLTETEQKVAHYEHNIRLMDSQNAQLQTLVEDAKAMSNDHLHTIAQLREVHEASQVLAAASMQGSEEWQKERALLVEQTQESENQNTVLRSDVESLKKKLFTITSTLQVRGDHPHAGSGNGRGSVKQSVKQAHTTATANKVLQAAVGTLKHEVKVLSTQNGQLRAENKSLRIAQSEDGNKAFVTLKSYTEHALQRQLLEHQHHADELVAIKNDELRAKLSQLQQKSSTDARKQESAHRSEISQMERAYAGKVDRLETQLQHSVTNNSTSSNSTVEVSRAQGSVSGSAL
jgi:chromosome segregation ATPase